MPDANVSTLNISLVPALPLSPSRKPRPLGLLCPLARSAQGLTNTRSSLLTESKLTLGLTHRNGAHHGCPHIHLSPRGGRNARPTRLTSVWPHHLPRASCSGAYARLHDGALALHRLRAHGASSPRPLTRIAHHACPPPRRARTHSSASMKPISTRGVRE